MEHGVAHCFHSIALFVHSFDGLHLAYGAGFWGPGIVFISGSGIRRVFCPFRVYRYGCHLFAHSLILPKIPGLGSLPALDGGSFSGHDLEFRFSLLERRALPLEKSHLLQLDLKETPHGY